jgi:transposase InsO family protein
MQITKAGVAMERIATDILGELPVTARGHKYILAVSDYFSKWTECFPMCNMEAETVARLIVEQVIVRFGVPYSIHSDQGTQYESRLFKETCKLLGIKKTRTTPYHPKSDGMAERFDKTLASMLRAYIDEHQRDWDTHLPYLMMAYRSAEHEATGCTPNSLMIGREVAAPLDIMYEMPGSISATPHHQWAWEPKEKL